MLPVARFAISERPELNIPAFHVSDRFLYQLIRIFAMTNPEKPSEQKQEENPNHREDFEETLKRAVTSPPAKPHQTSKQD